MQVLRRFAALVAAATWLAVFAGMVTLLATGASAQIRPRDVWQYQVAVTPDGSTTPNRPPSSGPYSAKFTVQNTGSYADTYALTCSTSSNVTCTGLSTSSVTLNPGGKATIFATYTVGAVGTGTLTLRARSDESGVQDTGFFTVPVVVPAPTITIVAPGDTVYSRTPLILVTYTNGSGTVDTSTLAVTWGSTSVKALGRYHDRLFEWEVDGASHELSPGGTKQLYVYVCTVSGPCSSVSPDVLLAPSPRPILSLKPMPLEAHGRQFAAPFGPGIGVSGGGAKCRVALEAAFLGTSSYPAGRKWLRVEAQATIGGTPYTVYDSVEVVLVERRTTPYGSGWWPSGVMRLVSSGDDAILVASDGNASVFRGAGSGAAYLAPPGQTATLVKVGSTWELRFRGGGKVTFDSYGRQTTIVDINGNTDSITYHTTDQVNRITDPKGKSFTFSYGNPNSTVSVFPLMPLGQFHYGVQGMGPIRIK
jgi:hypothetical protein